jgi:hypothetical protein
MEVARGNCSWLFFASVTIHRLGSNYWASFVSAVACVFYACRC